MNNTNKMQKLMYVAVLFSLR